MDYLDGAAITAIVFAAASSGAIFSPGSWYAQLEKPSWTPPDWAFPVVWTTLYVMIAIAGWLVWRADGLGVPIAFWIANLVFNAAWSWIMFGRRQIGLALVDALLMLGTIVGFMVTASAVSMTAVWLFAPYLVWVITAIALNYEVLRRNPGVVTG